MLFILLPTIIVLLIIIISKLNSVRNINTRLENNIHKLNEKLIDISNTIARLQQENQTIIPPPPVAEIKLYVPPQPVAEIKPVWKEAIKEEPLIIQPIEHVDAETSIETATIEPAEQTTPFPLPQSKESWFQQWLRNNPDIEKFIGENLINKIGIAVLILGIAFFVKYAIDQEWINEVGRISIGLFCGIILIGLAHRLRENYRSFSSVLVGGGLTVFYFTIAFAFHQYQLMSQGAAFTVMVVITAFAVILSILYNRLELAILATIGGFITPFLVSNGDGNYAILFSYVCILNAGLIVLSLYKRWHVLHFIAFVFTAIIYGEWIAANHSSKTFSYPGTFLFGTIFYLMFLTMNILLYLKKQVKFGFADAGLLIIVNVGYYAAGIFLLHLWQPDFKGLFTAALGVVNLLLATFLYKRKTIDRNFIYLVIGVTLTFISLAAPVQLEGNYITLFWAAELVLLFWLYQKSFIKLFKVASAFITILTFISLCIDWAQVYAFHSTLLPVIINKGFTTTVFCATAMGVMVMLLRKEADSLYFKGITNNAVRFFYTITSIIFFFIAGVLEICYQFNTRYNGTGLQYTYLLVYIPGFVLLLILLLSALKIKTGYFTQPFIAAIAIVYYLLSISNSYATEKLLLQTNTLRPHFIAHWAGIVLILLVILKIIYKMRQQRVELKELFPAFTWIIAVIVIIFFSVEVKNIYVWLIYQNPGSFAYAENLYNKAGLSIVWGLLSFTFIWLGMHHGFKTLRIIALFLFGITLLKLFAFDLKNIPPGGKIIAFILLGVLLLTVSFMYQRLKKLIIDDANKKSNTFILISFLFCAAAAAQNFSMKAQLDTVGKSGFYSINITPQLSSYLEEGFRDLRITDDEGKFVPYILRTASPSFSTQDYIKLPIVKDELADSGRTILILQNNTQQKISDIALSLRNATVTRTATISGSDDLTQWFTIDEAVNFEKRFVTDSDRYVQTIQFPASSYKYLKIAIDNRRNNPLNIIEAGIYTNTVTTTSQAYIDNPAASFYQTDSSDNNTYLNIQQHAAYHIERISISVKAPHFYKREMEVITGKGSFSFELISGKEQFFELPSFNDTSFLIKIYNGDNPALQVGAVTTQQENMQMVGYMEAGKNYSLLMQDTSAQKPVYDLKQFKDSIAYDIPVLRITGYEQLNTDQSNNTQVSKKWIWPIIILMLAVLAFFTVRLIREVNKQNPGGS